uniref:protein SRG1-like n=1 Tax=Erigeron canadensis TaxID=72917 RepID=UPI001CB9D535|nr:protein SRG1-like [Erigeron canadensis]
MDAKGRGLGSSILVPSVQELAKERLDKVPPRYIRLEDPLVVSSLPSSLPEVPIIDMEKLSSESELEKLHLACKDWGFFQIINHGVSEILLEKVKEETQEFFKLSLEEKKKFWQKEDDVEGFGQAFVVSEDQKLDWADMFFLTTLPHHMRKSHLFPNLPLPFRDTIEAYSEAVKDAAIKTLLYIAKALKMETKDMMELFDEGSMQSMRMNYYPPCPQPEQVMGLTPHSDAVGITFLLELNDVAGLQIKKDDIWIPVKALPNAFILNIGEIIEILTNGRYKSIEHRAIVNSEKERLSIATFLSPNLDGEIGPAASLITPETPPKFKRVTGIDFFRNLFSRELNSKTNLEQYYI